MLHTVPRPGMELILRSILAASIEPNTFSPCEAEHEPTLQVHWGKDPGYLLMLADHVLMHWKCNQVVLQAMWQERQRHIRNKLKTIYIMTQINRLTASSKFLGR